MKLPILTMAVACALVSGVLAAGSDERAQHLAEKVFAASGGESWANVRRIQFTFNVSKDDQVVVSAKHDWDVVNGVDAVTWGGKTASASVREKAQEGAEGEAYQRWVNDSYWLLAPLKLRDPGSRLTYQGERQVNGTKFEVIRIAFEKVGLTPGDQYDFYIDPQSKLVRHWTYMPSPDRKVDGTWEGYQEFGGLKLSTEHEFGGRRIWFSDIKVETVQ